MALDLSKLLVTAPYIAKRKLGEREVFRRLGAGSGGKAIAVSDFSEKLLKVFSKATSPTQAIENLGMAGSAEIFNSIEKMKAAGFLLEVQKIKIPFPSIELEVTNKCNASCVMCPREELRPLTDMNDHTFADVLGFIRSYPCPGVIIQGIGEPTIHKNLVAWIGDLRKMMGDSPPIAVVTNGFQVVPDYFAELIGAGLSHLQWSFHSLKEQTYNEIMGRARFAKAKENLVRCAERFGAMMSVNMVVMDQNKDEVDAIRHWLTQCGLRPESLQLVPCFSRGGTIDTRALLSGEEREIGGLCLYVGKSIFVAANGDLLPCSNDIRGGHVYGNVSTSSPEILFERWKRGLVCKDFKFDICENCDHFSRGTFQTEWARHVIGVSV